MNCVKKLILLLLLSAAFSLTVTKRIYGPELIDVNQTLEVEINITSKEPVRIERIVDEIPPEFVAKDYPAGCEQSEKELVCEFGQILEGKMNIRYKLLAISTGYGIIGSPRVEYEGGIATTNYFRPYYIGKPKIEISVKGNKTFLKGEEIVKKIEIRNEGIEPLKNVSLEVKAGNFSKTYKLNLNPREVKILEIRLGKARGSGVEEFKVNVRWGRGEKKYSETLIFVSPGMEVERKVKVVWRLKNGEILPVVQDILIVRNNGTAPGNYTLSTGESFILEPQKTKRIVKEYEKVAPAIKISLRDVRGELYTTLSFPEEKPEIRKGFLVLLYEYVANKIPIWVLLTMALISLYLGIKIKNNVVKTALLTIFVVSSLLIASYFSVGAISPILNRMISKGLALVPLPHI